MSTMDARGQGRVSSLRLKDNDSWLWWAGGHKSMSLALDGSKLDGSCQGKQRGLLLTFLNRRKDNLAGATCSDECALIQAGTIGVSTRDRNCMQLPPKSGEQNCWHPTSHASHSHFKLPQITGTNPDTLGMCQYRGTSMHYIRSSTVHRCVSRTSSRRCDSARSVQSLSSRRWPATSILTTATQVAGHVASR